eukprot:10551860-Karenia_brevis.AAC.1
MQKILTRGVYTDWQRSEAIKMMVESEAYIYREKWITDLKFPALPEHSGDSERFITDMLDFGRSHDRTGTTITKWIKPALYPTP